MKLLCCIVVGLLIALGAHASPKPSTKLLPLKLERVVDGDTIVASGRKIRLWGIDTPEKGHSLYRVAALYLQTILKDPDLVCQFIEKDHYKRDVMHCYVSGDDIGAMMVQMGLAIDYEKYSGGYYQAEQRDAQKQQRGLWKGYETY